MRNFRKQRIWHLGIDIAQQSYSLTKKLPNEEKYGLVSQMNRAAISISANIAEGCGRRGEKAFAIFLQYSLGSCFELESHYEVSKKIGYFTKDEIGPILESIKLEQRMLSALMKKLM